ncbi:MAG TPA: thiamine pyrophosphate-binding protein [Candidatus Nanoarchaeia archaeon]|nr:thiamine pyrophosphate-binding protein [Candidatus Nanoarchaeia archaeon]
MKVADYVIDFLGQKGIKDIFVVYGAANGDLIDAFVRTDKTRYVCTAHEQGGGFAAEGYAKILGIPSAAIATSGPGGQNFLTSIANFYYDSVPGIFITGQVNSKYMRPNKKFRQRGFQETPIVEMVTPVTKYAKTIINPMSIKYEMEKAWHISQEGRPGPVLLDFPINIQQEEVNIENLKSYSFKPSKDTSYNLKFIDNQIDSFLNDLHNSERPSIIIGGGVRIANGLEELLKVGEKLKIPMFPTWNAIDIVTDDYEFFGGRFGTYGGKGRNFGIQNSDLVLAIGSRISGRLFGSNSESFLRAAKKYLVNIENSQLEKKFQEIPFDENIHCDAKIFLEKLNSKIGKVKNFSPWMKWVAERRDKYDPVKSEFFDIKEPTHPYAFIRILSQEMEKGDILISDCGGNVVTVNHAFESKKGQRMITNNGNSPMGFSFAGAMGAWLASDKKHNTVCIIGDGGMTMNIQELQTVKNYNLGFKTFISNNHCYGITRQFQRTKFEGRQEACGPKGYSPPDFVKICEAYGIPTLTINNNSEAREKIKQVLNHKGPIVCDVNCHDWDNYEPRVFGGKSIEEMFPFLSREEFMENMIIDPILERKDRITSE